MGVEPIRHEREEYVGHLVRVPERHLHLVRLGALRLQASFHRLQAHVDADLPPIVAHQFHGDLLGRLEVEILEDDGQLRAVRVLTQAVAVHVVESKFVQERPRVVRVVADMRLGKTFLVPAARRVRRHLARHAASEVDHLVHLIPIDGMRESPDETPLALAPQQVPVLRVVVVVVGLDRHVADVHTVPDVNLVQPLHLAEFEQRNVLGLERKRGEIELTRRRLEGDHRRVLE